MHSMESNFSNRELIVDTINKLFIYTDQQNWDILIDEVFAPEIHVDITSMGAPKAETLTARELCNSWEKGFEGLDAVHHQAGNYLITIEDSEAKVFANAIASHYKASAKNGTSREFIGSYHLNVTKTRDGWRINRFVYQLKYMTGNKNLS